jgi:hypothetical protein
MNLVLCWEHAGVVDYSALPVTPSQDYSLRLLVSGMAGINGLDILVPYFFLLL